MNKERISSLLLKSGSIFLTCSIVLCPILMLYSIKISTVTFFDLFSLLSVCILVLSLLLQNKLLSILDKAFLPLVPFCVCVFASFLFSCILFGFQIDVLFRTLRYLYYVLIVILFVKFFDKNVGIKIFKWACIISTLFLFTQFVALQAFNKAISGYIKFLPMIDESLKAIAENASLIRNPRPRSFFQEPAHYAAYISMFIFLDLLYLKRSKINLPIDIFLFAGVIISSSTTGIIMCLLSFVAFFLKVIFEKRKKDIIIFSSLSIVFVITGIILISLGFLDSVVSKVTNVQSFLARFDGYRYVFDFSSFGSAFVTLFFGRGMLDLGTFYLSGYPRLLYYFGIVGLLCFSYSLISVNKKALPFATFFMIINLGTVSVLSPYMVLFFSLFISIAEPRKLKSFLRIKTLNVEYAEISIYVK